MKNEWEYGEKLLDLFREQVRGISSDSSLEKEILSSFGMEEEKIEAFWKKKENILEVLKEEEEVYFQKDPSIQDKREVAMMIPGFFAVMAHRFAYALSQLEVPLLPRLLAEIAHQKTGIDIHPRTFIGRRFFLDHGTGVVIGETAEIHDDVSIYQNVTLGAKSLKKGRNLVGKKRHPTIESGTTIYAGASILGGDVSIGERSTIGAGVTVVSSVEAETYLYFACEKDETNQCLEDCIYRPILVKYKKLRRAHHERRKKE